MFKGKACAADMAAIPSCPHWYSAFVRTRLVSMPPEDGTALRG